VPRKSPQAEACATKIIRARYAARTGVAIASIRLTLQTKEFVMHILSVYIPQSVIAWIIVGLIAGWLAGTVSRGRGFGCIADIILGMVGAVLGGWIFSKLNIRGGGLLYSIAAATVGAVILVAIARIFSGGGARS
jgi:uncharacterized membrane protein YeaQ/YmgE (transglycosylase-associated protein family)